MIKIWKNMPEIIITLRRREVNEQFDKCAVGEYYNFCRTVKAIFKESCEIVESLIRTDSFDNRILPCGEWSFMFIQENKGFQRSKRYFCHIGYEDPCTQNLYKKCANDVGFRNELINCAQRNEIQHYDIIIGEKTYTSCEVALAAIRAIIR